MTKFISKYFTMYEDCRTQEEQWESTKDLVDLCMKVIFIMTLIRWGF